LNILAAMKKQWPPSDYRVVGRNCQSFVVAVCEALRIGENCVPEQYRYFAEPPGPAWSVVNSLASSFGHGASSGSGSGSGSGSSRGSCYPAGPAIKRSL